MVWPFKNRTASEPEEIYPVTPRDRYRCPFYGFHAAGGGLFDSEGNQCALVGGHSPCRMELAGQTPDWDECTTFNYGDNVAKLEEVADSLVAFPMEFRPEEIRSWKGVPFRAWRKYVMRDNSFS